MSRSPITVLASPPKLDLAPRDVAALVDELQAYHAYFSPLFARREQREWGLQYLQGQLLDVPRKSIEPMALALPDGNVRAMQQFIGAGAWEDTAILTDHHRLVAETLGEPDGVLIVDGSEFPKQGTASVGVARQYCGALGKIANCQAGVFLAYASRTGYTLLDRRLYMPEEWFTPASKQRRQRCGVPPTLRFRTAPQLAWEMVKAVHTQGELPVGWVTFDEGFGERPALLGAVGARRHALSGRGAVSHARMAPPASGGVARAQPVWPAAAVRSRGCRCAARSGSTRWHAASPRRPGRST